MDVLNAHVASSEDQEQSCRVEQRKIAYRL